MPNETTIGLSKKETTFVTVLLRQSEEGDTNIEKSMELVKEAMGIEAMFVGGSEEFYTDPPTPEDIQEGLEGQRLTVTRPKVEALQTLITVFSFKLTMEEGSADYVGVLEVIDGLHKKIRDAYEELGGYEEEGYA